jgi:Holliday junction resolvase
MGSSGKERPFVRALDEAGYAVLRAPSSGSATKRDLPDVVIMKRDNCVGYVRTRTFVVEHKATSKTTAYVDEDEASALRRFATKAGATAYIGAYFKDGTRSPHYLVPLDECRITSGGNYGVPKSDARLRAERLVWTETKSEDARVEYVGEASDASRASED